MLLEVLSARGLRDADRVLNLGFWIPSTYMVFEGSVDLVTEVISKVAVVISTYNLN